MDVLPRNFQEGDQKYVLSLSGAFQPSTNSDDEDHEWNIYCSQIILYVIQFNRLIKIPCSGVLFFPYCSYSFTIVPEGFFQFPKWYITNICLLSPLTWHHEYYMKVLGAVVILKDLSKYLNNLSVVSFYRQL